jgi:hypothetical protein
MYLQDCDVKANEELVPQHLRNLPSRYYIYVFFYNLNA